MKNLLTPVLFILVIVVGYFYLVPLYDHVGLLQQKQDTHAELLASVQSIQSKINSLEAQYNSFSPRERGLLTRLIPREAKETVIINDLNALASSHGLIVTGVEFEIAEESTQNIAIGEEDTSLLGSRYKEWNSTINIQGSYDSFKNFLTDLGRSMRIADVSSIGVRQSSTGGLSLTEYQVVTTIYSLE